VYQLMLILLQQDRQLLLHAGAVTVDAKIETGWGRGKWGNRAWGDNYSVILKDKN
jgi:hypothetical protein